MNATTRHNLVSATLAAADSVIEKRASASDEQNEVLNAAWPTDDGQITKLATLSKILATGLMVEEAEASAG